jgi:CheY-like chemotaxis protein
MKSTALSPTTALVTRRLAEKRAGDEEKRQEDENEDEDEEQGAAEVADPFSLPNVAIDEGRNRKKSDFNRRASERILRVLCVDDDKFCLEVITDCMKEIGHGVIQTAVDGAQAVSVYKKHHTNIDVIMLDSNMPKLSGNQAAKEIRQFEKESGLPAVVIFTLAFDVNTETEQECKASGADKLLDKVKVGAMLKTLTALAAKLAETEFLAGGGQPKQPTAPPYALGGGVGDGEEEEELDGAALLAAAAAGGGAVEASLAKGARRKSSRVAREFSDELAIKIADTLGIDANASKHMTITRRRKRAPDDPNRTITVSMDGKQLPEDPMAAIAEARARAASEASADTDGEGSVGGAGAHVSSLSVTARMELSEEDAATVLFEMQVEQLLIGDEGALKLGLRVGTTPRISNVPDPAAVAAAAARNGFVSGNSSAVPSRRGSAIPSVLECWEFDTTLVARGTAFDEDGDRDEDEDRTASPPPSLSNDTLGGDMLYRLVLRMFFDSGVAQECELSPPQLASMVHATKQRYNDVPYHNWLHAATVTHVVFLLLQTTGLRSALDRFDKLGLLMASVCHDTDHRGFNNAFEINTMSELAVRYNDNSVLENHHAATAFQIMQDDEANDVFSVLSERQMRHVRRVMISSILATDMVCAD